MRERRSQHNENKRRKGKFRGENVQIVIFFNLQKTKTTNKESDYKLRGESLNTLTIFLILIGL